MLDVNQQTWEYAKEIPGETIHSVDVTIGEQDVGKAITLKHKDCGVGGIGIYLPKIFVAGSPKAVHQIYGPPGKVVFVLTEANATSCERGCVNVNISNNKKVDRINDNPLLIQVTFERPMNCMRTLTCICRQIMEVLK